MFYLLSICLQKKSIIIVSEIIIIIAAHGPATIAIETVGAWKRIEIPPFPSVALAEMRRKRRIVDLDQHILVDHRRGKRSCRADIVADGDKLALGRLGCMADPGLARLVDIRGTVSARLCVARLAQHRRGARGAAVLRRNLARVCPGLHSATTGRRACAPRPVGARDTVRRTAGRGARTRKHGRRAWKPSADRCNLSAVSSSLGICRARTRVP